MTFQRVNDHDQFVWLSTDMPPARASTAIGAKGHILDTGEHLVYDGNGWVPDLTWVWVAKILKQENV